MNPDLLPLEGAEGTLNLLTQRAADGVEGGNMPRYLVKRNFGHIADDQMEMRGRKSKALIRDQFTELTWEHSHVVASPEGEVFLFCVYGAPDEDSVRAHADALGGHTVEAVYEIGGDVSPADFTI